jgi:hypothetical protein
LNNLKFILLVLVLLNCKKQNYKTYQDPVKYHAASKSYEYTKTNSWTDRVYLIDPLHIDYVLKQNEIDGFTEIPVPSSQLEVDKKKILTLSKTLSPQISALFEKYIFAIYFCKNLGGSGITGFIYNEKQIPVGGFIIFDSEVLNKKANEWISYKENTVFFSSKLELKIKIEEPQNDTVENALLYILLHEFGHVLSNTLNITPDQRSIDSFQNYPFFQKVWNADLEINETFTKYNFLNRVFFYTSDKKISLEEKGISIYSRLKESPFPTLYGATSGQDHFAESFVSYVHCKLEKKPWVLTIRNPKTNEILFEMQNPILQNQFEMDFFDKLIP